MTACDDSEIEVEEEVLEEHHDKLELFIGTGMEGGTYLPVGDELVNIWNRHLEHIHVKAIESNASVENLEKIANDEFDLALTVNLPAYDALAGIGDFDGNPIENVVFISHIKPEPLQIITRERTGIKSLEDLRGKRIAIGESQSGTHVIAKLVLEAIELHEGDYEAFEVGFDEAKTMLQNDEIDVSFGHLVLPDVRVDELHESVGDVKLLKLTDEVVAFIEENSGYKAYTLPESTYEWLDDSVQTVAAYSILVANTNSIDDDLAYQLVKVMYEHTEEYTHSQTSYLTIENAFHGSTDLPLHPGAEKYYKEVGMKQDADSNLTE